MVKKPRRKGQNREEPWVSKEKRRRVGVGFDLGPCVLLQKPVSELHLLARLAGTLGGVGGGKRN